MTNETELQSEIKRLTQAKEQAEMQLSFLKQQSMGVGYTFAGVIRELLLAIGDPEDAEGLVRARRHAKELLKHWELTVDQQSKQGPAPLPTPSNGTPTSS